MTDSDRESNSNDYRIRYKKTSRDNFTYVPLVIFDKRAQWLSKCVKIALKALDKQ